MKVYDCFTFYNEFDTLEIRLQEMWDQVDHFVIAEANTTHSGVAKPFMLLDNWERFKPYADSGSMLLYRNDRLWSLFDLQSAHDHGRVDRGFNPFI